MLEILKDVLIDSLIDTIKLLPFLFITFLIMEYIEHKMTEKSKTTIQKAGKMGPLFGGLVGIIPQCGFSASVTNLYAARVISLGTLIAVYLSTSDEMLPILISEAVPMSKILKVIAIKLIIGIIVGFIVDFVLRIIKKGNKKTEIEHEHIDEICDHEHCHCEEEGIFKSAVKHTINIVTYIFVITFIIGLLVELVGEESISNFVGTHTVLGPVISSLLGLIPNCAASVLITNLYIQNIINGSSLIAGLLTGAGVGLIVLFRMNKHLKENIMIVSLIYLVGVISGIVLQLLGIVI